MAEITKEMIDAALDATDFAKGPVSRRWMRKALVAAIGVSPISATRCEALEKALEPFANCVFNDNGDLSVNRWSVDSEDLIRAYFTLRGSLIQKKEG